MTVKLCCPCYAFYLCPCIYHDSMYHTDKRDISEFCVVGINYKKTDAHLRGKFAISNEQYARILDRAREQGLSTLFILSTCNRTEMYGFAENKQQLVDLLCTETEGDAATFAEIAYEKKGWDGIDHLFRVSAGLDSQILGDYEILGQIKNAAKFAKEQGFVCPFLERLLNSSLQSSKAVKTNTTLSGGTVSVSFAVAQYIKDHVANITGKKIVLFGTGKIGRNACRNMVDYLETTNITLINRTEEKATNLAAELGLKSAPIENLEAELAGADIILVATGANEPTVLREHLEGKGDKLVIDLSVPCNVAVGAQMLPNVSFVNVDELSRITDHTLKMREAEVPKATIIIRQHITEFEDWYEMRKHVPMLKHVKGKLQQLQSDSHITTEQKDDERIQKVINSLATKMRRRNTIGCHYIEAINEFIA